jgi:IS5 family transposase
MQFPLGFAGYHEVNTGNQISLDDFEKPADWPEGKNWGTFTMDASCTPADIAYSTESEAVERGKGVE